tara:strand:+ start:882 stop:1730 length:849 start_codon:yes stop_codon:yes gene_type:complete
MLQDSYHIFDPENPTISKSELDLINKSPALYKRQIIDGIKPKPGRALTFGQAFHASVLEPMDFQDGFIVQPDELAALKKTTKAGKEAHAQFAVEHEGKTILTPQEGRDLAGMTQAIFAHPIASKLIQDAAQVEQAHFADFSQSHGRSVVARCKPDLITKSGVVVDLKSTASDLPDWFSKAAEPFRYDVQAVHYSAVLAESCGVGFDPSEFLFVVVTKSAPYSCAVFALESEDCVHASDEWAENMQTYARCLRDGVWPTSFENQSQVTRRFLPGWRRRRRAGR